MIFRFIFDEDCPIHKENWEDFQEFLVKILIFELRVALKKKQKYFLPLYKLFGLRVSEVARSLTDIVKATRGNGCVYVTLSGTYKKRAVFKAIKSVEFGSVTTGLPKPFFAPLIRDVLSDKKGLYKRYLMGMLSDR